MRDRSGDSRSVGVDFLEEFEDAGLEILEIGCKKFLNIILKLAEGSSFGNPDITKAG